MKLLSTFLILSSFILTACDGDNTGIRRVVGEGNGVCNDKTDVTPFDLDQDSTAPASLNELLATGSIRVLNVRVTIEGETLSVGHDKSVLVLGSAGDFQRISKLCANGFSPKLGIDEAIKFRVPVSFNNAENEFVYAVYSVDYGPRYLTEETEFVYMKLDGILSNDPNFIDPFSDEPLNAIQQFFNDTNAKAFIKMQRKKKDEFVLPEAFEKDEDSKPYSIAYQDPETGLRYHLNIIWTKEKPPEEDGEENDNEQEAN